MSSTLYLPTVACLAPELIQQIVHMAVSDDLALREGSPLPASKSKFWETLADAQNTAGVLGKCVEDAYDVVTSGFLPRTTECCIRAHSSRNGFTISGRRSDRFSHPLIGYTHVCRNWRSALLGYARLWEDTTLLAPGHFTTAVQRARHLPLKLVCPLPLCTCLIQEMCQFIMRATDIMFSMKACTYQGYQVSEIVFHELFARSLTQEGSIIETLDLRLTGPLPVCQFEERELHSLRKVVLANTHFVVYGRNLQRLEILAERAAYRRPLGNLLAILGACTALESLSLRTCIKLPGSQDLAVNALDMHIDLPNLSFFSLTDLTGTCIRALQYIDFPSAADFHMVCIEGFGKVNYGVTTLRSNLMHAAYTFMSRLEPHEEIPILTIEVIRDCEHTRYKRLDDVGEWPEEIRLSFGDNLNWQQEYYRRTCYRVYDHLLRPYPPRGAAPNRTFAVRSAMLSTHPTLGMHRCHPQVLRRDGNVTYKEYISSPALTDVLRAVMDGAEPVLSSIGIATVLLPPHAYIPCTPEAWNALLSHLDMTSLIVSVSDEDQAVGTLWNYLATKRNGLWSHERLGLVSLPHYNVDPTHLTAEEFNSVAEKCCGERRGCTDIYWDVGCLSASTDS